MRHLENSTARWREYGRAGSSSSLANPDFVNTAEGIFCRIGDKTTCPVSVVDATAGDDDGADNPTAAEWLSWERSRQLCPYSKVDQCIGSGEAYMVSGWECKEDYREKGWTNGFDLEVGVV